jgi:DUF2905 family protein
MLTFGKFFLILGVVFIILGAILTLAPRLGIVLGRLPGDIRIERNGSGLYIALATSLLVSLILTVVVNVILRLLKR